MVVQQSVVRRITARISLAGLLLFGLLAANVNPANGQNPYFPGYLGVYVMNGDRGMTITGFIRNTPARALAEQGRLSRQDTILRLGGMPTRTLSELQSARNCIPPGKEGKMVLRDRWGGYYHVWISRSDSVAAASAPAEFRDGGAGVGVEPDVREIGPAVPDQKPAWEEETGEIRDR